MTGSTSKLPWPSGGDVVAAHSMVVACHGLSSTFFLPRQAAKTFAKKLRMNGTWNASSPIAEIDMNGFVCSAITFAWAYWMPPSYSRRDTPASPCRNIGKKTPLMQRNDPQKCTRPQKSFNFLPVILGNQ